MVLKCLMIGYQVLKESKGNKWQNVDEVIANDY